jgi:hypothetical protein
VTRLSGLRDKLYWRKVGRNEQLHCFKRAPSGLYRSICGTFSSVWSGGQACARPEPILRRAVCDAKESYRRGWDGSGPTLRALLGAS